MKLKKKEGKVDKYAILVISLVSVFIIVIVSIYAFSDMDKKSKIDRVGRNYIMLMESKGYLSSTDEQEMIKDLKKIGVTNISTVGTTKAKVGYGKDIKLKVSGKVATNTFNIKGIFEVDRKDSMVDVYIDESSISKD